MRTSSRLGESPRWDHRRGELVWVDILGRLVHLSNPDGTTRSFPVDREVGSVALYGEGAYLLALRDGFGVWEDGTLRSVSTVDAPGLRLNDGAVDPAGRFLAGTTGLEDGGMVGRVYSREVDGSVRVVLEGVSISNGLAWSDHGATLYYVDSAAGGVDIFDYDAGTGTLSNRRRHIEVPPALGVADGIALDAEGCLWVAIYGGGQVCRYSPAGMLIARVDVPAAQTTACCFGGPQLDTMFITTATQHLDLSRPEHALSGGLFVAEPGCGGRPERVVPLSR
ncbi:MAG: SMP-30/gluconolactonase/LRE family protein [Actinomycetota bacterium]